MFTPPVYSADKVRESSDNISRFAQQNQGVTTTYEMFKVASRNVTSRAMTTRYHYTTIVVSPTLWFVLQQEKLTF